MTREKAKMLIDAIVALRNSATDEQALEAINIYPEWKESVEYIVGDRVLYNEVLYKVLQAHTSQSGWVPDAAPSLFARVLIPDTNVIYDWIQPDSTNPYMKGDRVKYNDQIWESIVDNNVWAPGVYGWELRV